MRGIADGHRRPPPRHLGELRVRAEALAGRTLGEVAEALGMQWEAAPGARTKGRVGTLIERALGASAGSSAGPDFPEIGSAWQDDTTLQGDLALHGSASQDGPSSHPIAALGDRGVELKTIPIDAAGRVRESTFIASLRLGDAADAVWETSSVRAKLGHVLWVPVEAAAPERPDAMRRIGRPLFWRPTDAQAAILRADFEELVGLLAIGQVERLDARRGRWLQIRPKAAHGRIRTAAIGDDGEPVITVPRGFYLRARFTAALLRDPAALPA